MLSCSFDECSQIWTQTTDYFQVVGIILGQLTVGFLGDWLGRRWGMVQVCRLAWRVLHFSALPCPALPCPALPCPALPCPALPCPALPCPV